jgi:hypothetical protein
MTEYTPNTANCVFWFDANDSACIFTGSTTAVTGLKDKSGVGNNATSLMYGSGGTGSAFAQITSNAINGLPALYLNNTGFNGQLTASSTGSVCSFYCVMNPITNANNYWGRLLALGNTNTTNDAWDLGKYSVCFNQNTNKLSLIRNGITADTSISFNTPYIVSGYFDNTNGYIFLNGTLISSVASTGAFNFTKFGIGTSSYTTVNPVGDNVDKIYMGEVLLYQAAHTSTDRQKTEGYLAWKWGLQSNLPVDHTYKTAAPPSTTIHANVQPTEPIIITEPISSRFMQLLMME